MGDVHNGLLCCVWEGKPICVPTHHKYTPKAKSYLGPMIYACGSAPNYDWDVSLES